jgi:hypothetical protein
VPAPATVYATDRELYIIKAPLSVKLESEYLRKRGESARHECSGAYPGVAERSEAVYRKLVLPRIQRAVRRAPEYAALRRVYFSRVAAEWYRDRAARRGGAYADIIDSYDITPWRQRRSWRPRDVFNRYVRSFKHGEFNLKRVSREGNLIMTRSYIFGGVDFTSVPLRQVNRAELKTLRPGIKRRLARALWRPTADRETGTIWLAGASFDRAKAATDPAFGHPTPATARPATIIAQHPSGDKRLGEHPVPRAPRSERTVHAARLHLPTFALTVSAQELSPSACRAPAADADAGATAGRRPVGCNPDRALPRRPRHARLTEHRRTSANAPKHADSLTRDIEVDAVRELVRFMVHASLTSVHRCLFVTGCRWLMIGGQLVRWGC